MSSWKLAFSFAGRINRRTFIRLSILSFIFIVIILGVTQRFEKHQPELVGFVGGCLLIAWVISSLSLCAKRWHDIGRSGWMTLLVVILAGIVSGFNDDASEWILVIGFALLSLMPGTKGKNKYDNPMLSSHYNENNNAHQAIMNAYTDLIAMLAKIAKSDGAITQNEIIVVEAFFEQAFAETGGKAEAIEIFRKSKDSPMLFEEHARRFHAMHGDKEDVLKGVLGVLFRVTVADGNMCAEEEILFNQAIYIFGVSSAEYEQYKNQEKYKPGKASDDAIYYANVLGLKGKVTKKDIRKQYLQLVKEYHPDKVSHLGDKLRTVAEEEMKKINEAYDYFKKTYNF